MRKREREREREREGRLRKHTEERKKRGKNCVLVYLDEQSD